MTQSILLRQPATRWQDALPCGDGTVGLLMPGRLSDEAIVLNQDRCWYPKPRQEPPAVADLLPHIRELCAAGRWQEAQEVHPQAFAERLGAAAGSTSTWRDAYQPLAALRLCQVLSGAHRGYRRGLDLDRGLAWVAWADDAGQHRREAFVERGSGLVHLRISSSQPAAVTLRLRLELAPEEQGGVIAADGLELTVLEQQASAEGDLCLRVAWPDGNGFWAQGQVRSESGTRRVVDGWLHLEQADAVEVVLRVGVGASDASPLPSEGFAPALARSAAIHQGLMDRVALDLGRDERTLDDQLADAFDGTVSPALVATLADLGRHLLCSASAPGSWPINLQGIWNGDWRPAWNSDFHWDINVQMAYWPALPCRLDECVEPLFDFVAAMGDDYRANARDCFGCRGVLVPVAHTTHGREYPSIWTSWTAGAAWIGLHLWQTWEYGRDEQLLRERVLPWLVEVAEFYEDFLVPGADGLLHAVPSLSPENVAAVSGAALICADASMDVTVIREALANLIAGSRLLGLHGERIPVWQGIIDRLPPLAVAPDGSLREWLHPGLAENHHHRHISHLYGLHPGTAITAEDTPVLAAAARVSLQQRQVLGLASQSGWSHAHNASCWARLGDGDRALACLQHLIRSCVGPNGFTYHNDWRDMALTLAWDRNPPFQIDANLGLTAAVCEMLAFSKPGLLRVLPALPSSWRQGSVRGLGLCAGHVLDVSWDQDALSIAVTLHAARADCLRLRAPACCAADDEYLELAAGAKFQRNWTYHDHH